MLLGMKLWLLSLSIFVTSCGGSIDDPAFQVAKCRKVNTASIAVIGHDPVMGWYLKECYIPPSPMTLEEIEDWRPR